MENFDVLKKQWGSSFAVPRTIPVTELRQVIKLRVKNNLKASMHYFWASLAMQIFMYSMLTHVLIKYGIVNQIYSVGALAILGMLLYIPFTIMLMKKFKAIARLSTDGSDKESIYTYVLRKRNLLEGFFIFKRRYERVLIPIAVAIAVWILFSLVASPEAVFTPAALSIYLLSLAGCYLAIRAENRKNFEGPIHEMNALLKEFEQ
jgi:hypothetical protein